MKTQRAALLLGISVATLAVGGALYAQSHVMAPLASTAWGAAPPMLPAGAQIAMLSGDPSKPSAYAVRLKFPANYAIPAHSHRPTRAWS